MNEYDKIDKNRERKKEEKSNKDVLGLEDEVDVLTYEVSVWKNRVEKLDEQLEREKENSRNRQKESMNRIV